MDFVHTCVFSTQSGRKYTPTVIMSSKHLHYLLKIAEDQTCITVQGLHTVVLYTHYIYSYYKV